MYDNVIVAENYDIFCVPKPTEICQKQLFYGIHFYVHFIYRLLFFC